MAMWFKTSSDVPGVRVGVGSARLRPQATHGIGYPAIGQNLETGQPSRFYITEISMNVTLNFKQPTTQTPTAILDEKETL